MFVVQVQNWLPLAKLSKYNFAFTFVEYSTGLIDIYQAQRDTGDERHTLRMKLLYIYSLWKDVLATDIYFIVDWHLSNSNKGTH